MVPMRAQIPEVRATHEPDRAVLRRRLGVTAKDARQRVPTGFIVCGQVREEQAAFHESWLGARLSRPQRSRVDTSSLLRARRPRAAQAHHPFIP